MKVIVAVFVYAAALTLGIVLFRGNLAPTAVPSQARALDAADHDRQGAPLLLCQPYCGSQTTLSSDAAIISDEWASLTHPHSPGQVTIPFTGTWPTTWPGATWWPGTTWPGTTWWPGPATWPGATWWPGTTAWPGTTWLGTTPWLRGITPPFVTTPFVGTGCFTTGTLFSGPGPGMLFAGDGQPCNVPIWGGCISCWDPFIGASAPSSVGWIGNIPVIAP